MTIATVLLVSTILFSHMPPVRPGAWKLVALANSLVPRSHNWLPKFFVYYFIHAIMISDNQLRIDFFTYSPKSITVCYILRLLISSSNNWLNAWKMKFNQKTPYSVSALGPIVSRSAWNWSYGWIVTSWTYWTFTAIACTTARIVP